MAPDPANFLHQLPQKESGKKLYGSRSPPTFFISSLKKNPAKNYMAPDPANSLISSLKKNLAENYMAPDPANFVHQLPQKNPASSSRKKNWKEEYGSNMALDPANFLHQLPQKELEGKSLHRYERGRVLGLNSFSQLFKAEFG